MKIIKLVLALSIFFTACHSLNNLTVTDFKESVCMPHYPINAQIFHVKDSLYKIHYYIVTKNIQKYVSADGSDYQDFSITIHAFPSFSKNILLDFDSINYEHSLSSLLPDTLFLSSDLQLPPNQTCAIELNLKDLKKNKHWTIVKTTIGSYHPNHQNLLLKSTNNKILFKNYLIENKYFIAENSLSDFQFVARLPLPSDFPEPPFIVNNLPKKEERPIPIQPILCNSPFEPHFHGLLLSNHSNISIPVFPENYPELSKWDSINLLRYICTEKEFQLITNEGDPTLAWALFISETKGSREASKNKEARFYESAKNANILFTENRFGWLTDRGMIYIVFGIPSKVIRSDGFQTWLYQNAENPFESIQVDFIETKTGYELIRSENLRIAWFNAIENWRIR